MIRTLAPALDEPTVDLETLCHCLRQTVQLQSALLVMTWLTLDMSADWNELYADVARQGWAALALKPGGGVMDMINDGQTYALNKLLEPYTGKDREARLYVVSQLIGREVMSTKALTLLEWRMIRNQAYFYDPEADEQQWEVLSSFKA